MGKHKDRSFLLAGVAKTREYQIFIPLALKVSSYNQRGQYPKWIKNKQRSIVFINFL